MLSMEAINGVTLSALLFWITIFIEYEILTLGRKLPDE